MLVALTPSAGRTAALIECADGCVLVTDGDVEDPSLCFDDGILAVTDDGVEIFRGSVEHDTGDWTKLVVISANNVQSLDLDAQAYRFTR
jgi:hypothetical protein